MLKFTANVELLAAADQETDAPRIAGVAVPWNVTATVAGGQKVRFLKGAFNVNQKAAKLVENHDLTQLREVRAETLRIFAEQDDTWLDEPLPFWGTTGNRHFMVCSEQRNLRLHTKRVSDDEEGPSTNLLQDPTHVLTHQADQHEHHAE